jgi:hypothetical protein
MPLVESAEIARVNVEGDNINLTAADVDSFDVAVSICAKASLENEIKGERLKGRKER